MTMQPMTPDDYALFDSMDYKVETINDGWFYNQGDINSHSWGLYKTTPNDDDLVQVSIT